LTKAATEQLKGALEGFVTTRNANAPGMFLNLEETATKSGGGCANMSGEDDVIGVVSSPHHPAPTCMQTGTRAVSTTCTRWASRRKLGSTD